MAVPQGLDILKLPINFLWKCRWDFVYYSIDLRHEIQVVHTSFFDLLERFAAPFIYSGLLLIYVQGTLMVRWWCATGTLVCRGYPGRNQGLVWAYPGTHHDGAARGAGGCVAVRSPAMNISV